LDDFLPKGVTATILPEQGEWVVAGEILRRFALAGGQQYPYYIHFDRDQAGLWVPWNVPPDEQEWTFYDTTLKKYSMEGVELASFIPGYEPSYIVQDSAGDLYVTCGAEGNTSSAPSGGARIVKYDTSGAVIWTAQNDFNPIGLAIGADGMLYCGQLLNASVAILNPANGTVVKVLTQEGLPGNNSIQLRAVGSYVWVCNNYAGTLARIDTATQEFDLSVSLGARSFPIDLVADPETGYLWVCAGAPLFNNFHLSDGPDLEAYFQRDIQSALVVVNPSTGAIIATHAVSGEPYNILYDGRGFFWVAQSRNNTVCRVNRSGDVVGTYATAEYPICLTQDGRGDVWVANYFRDGSDQFWIVCLSGSDGNTPTRQEGSGDWPMLFAAPAISRSGDTLSVTSGSWSDGTVVSYQWQVREELYVGEAYINIADEISASLVAPGSGVFRCAIRGTKNSNSTLEPVYSAAIAIE
jgi:DNA-binding beta-propeller fold protein YncE